ncbi:MAG TPA: hypothetical protein PKY12_01170 [Catalimonadaceae bacterium]|jgi:hypothetical protein|nr:hypothetical protein [Catalimonadaceae bacterium]
MNKQTISPFLFLLFFSFGAYSQGHISILGGFGFTSLQSSGNSNGIDLSGLGGSLAIRGGNSAKWGFGFCAGYQHTSNKREVPLTP